MSIRRRVRTARPDQQFQRWALLAVAALVMTVGTAGILRLRDYREGLLHQVAVLLGVGSQDHIQCALAGHYPPVPPDDAKVLENMGSDYAGLVPVVRQRFPEMEFVEGHYCSVNNRKFAHVILRREGRLISVAVTRKGAGEGFPQSVLLKTLASGALPVYPASVDQLNVAGFETGGHLGFVVSDLGQDEVVRMASILTGPVRQFLARIEA